MQHVQPPPPPQPRVPPQAPQPRVWAAAAAAPQTPMKSADKAHGFISVVTDSASKPQTPAGVRIIEDYGIGRWADVMPTPLGKMDLSTPMRGNENWSQLSPVDGKESPEAKD